ncbi:MAG TPA: ribonuclease H-like domain-containing protein [Oculatellaceae cyanobacterium]
MTEVLIKQLKPDFYELDLPDERFQHYSTKTLLALDTETRGLNLHRDRLCLVQICDDEGVVSLVRYKHQIDPAQGVGANLKKLLENEKILKIFHYARFDISVLKYHLRAQTNPVFCTKIASKLVRTYTDRHSLKDLVREIFRKEMDKSDQMSDWARDDLTESQLEYAANDVRVLIPIYEHIKSLLEREGRLPLAKRVCECLPVVCDLDMKGFTNVFEH